ICGTSDLLEEAKRHLDKSSFQDGTVISYVEVKDYLQLMQPHHRKMYQKKLVEIEEGEQADKYYTYRALYCEEYDREYFEGDRKGDDIEERSRIAHEQAMFDVHGI